MQSNGKQKRKHRIRQEDKRLSLSILMVHINKQFSQQYQKNTCICLKTDRIFLKHYKSRADFLRAKQLNAIRKSKKYIRFTIRFLRPIIYTYISFPFLLYMYIVYYAQNSAMWNMRVMCWFCALISRRLDREIYLLFSPF